MSDSWDGNVYYGDDSNEKVQGSADLVYDQKTGILSFDADGSHGGAAIDFAQLTPGTALTEHNFAVV